MPVTNCYTVNGEIIGEETNGQRIDYLTDPLGNITATIDQNAKVLNRYTYKPFNSHAPWPRGQDPNDSRAAAQGFGTVLPSLE